jgi:hypothetical protein
MFDDCVMALEAKEDGMKERHEIDAEAEPIALGHRESLS